MCDCGRLGELYVNPILLRVSDYTFINPENLVSLVGLGEGPDIL